MIRLGGPVFIQTTRTAGAGETHGSDLTDPEILVQAHQAKGYRAAYAPNVGLNEREKIRDIRKAFEKADIVIAEVGYWKNPLHLNEGERKTARNQMIDTLALAEEFGARCAVSNVGSYVDETVRYHNEVNFTDQAFDAAVENARAVIDAVKPQKTTFSYEMFPFNILDNPESIRRLIDAVDRPQFAVHMDLVNLVHNPRTYYRNGQIIRRCVEIFGHKIVSAHAKDIKMAMPAISVILNEVPPGTGNLDYKSYLRCLNDLPHNVPLMMEHMKSPEEYDGAAAYIRKTAATEGISL
jgi:sugar phosphate isomerase/epimerase